jgi:MFS transporter, PAT family, beta-lactamase induction signal transducer AmpG
MTLMNDSLKVFLYPRMWLALFMGFSSGLPLLLTITVLQAWLSYNDISLATIGLMGLIGLPYSVKFLWAPLIDRFYVNYLGRRRFWLFLSQGCLVVCIFILGFQDPQISIRLIILSSLGITFFSATQDIAVDAYRRESLLDNEQGLGAMMYTYGYRLGMLLASAGGLIIADQYGFNVVYLFMASVMGLTLVITYLSPEPENFGSSTTLMNAFILPLKDFNQRFGGFNKALLVLMFIILYKLGDNFASHMSIPFYLGSGYTNTEIGAVVKLFGLGPLLIGIFLGGMVNLRYGLFYALILAGVLQAISTFGFALIAVSEKSLILLSAVISFENLSGGMGTASLLAFMALLTNKQFTATQFALLSALAALPRVILTAPTGWLAMQTGWLNFFIFSGLIAIPGMVLLIYYGKQWLNGKH